MQGFIFIYNYCTVLVNGSNFARFLNIQTRDAFDNALFRDPSFTKFITFGFMILLISSIRSAEYLKYPSLFSTLAILVSLLVFWSINAFKTGFNNLHDAEAFAISGALPLVSSQVYSIESVGTLLTIRMAMREPTKINRVVLTVFLLSLSLFLFNGWSFMLSYRSPVEMAFYYFKGNNYLVLVLRFCFYLTLPATICITMFTLFSIFESFPILKNTLGVEHSEEEPVIAKGKKKSLIHITSFGLSIRTQQTFEKLQKRRSKEIGIHNSQQKSSNNFDKNSQIESISGNKSKISKKSEQSIQISKKKSNAIGTPWYVRFFKSKLLKIIGMRLVFGCIFFFPFMLNINEYFLILLTGSLISPCLGFIFPIIAYNICFKEELKQKKSLKFFNMGVLVAGIILNLASFVYTVQKAT